MGRHRSDFGAMARPDIDGILLVGWWPRICQGFECCVACSSVCRRKCVQKWMRNLRQLYAPSRPPAREAAKIRWRRAVAVSLVA